LMWNWLCQLSIIFNINKIFCCKK